MSSSAGLDPPAPNRLWVADLTCVSTWSGFAYVAYVIDVYARRILGWRVASTMATSMVLDAIEHAIWTRQQEGVSDLKDVVHHTDRGSQYTSIRFSERLAEARIQPSVGAVGSSYDNALAETINGPYKTELIKPGKPWRSIKDVEQATARWIDCFNTAASKNTAAISHRPNSRLPITLNAGDQPPAEFSDQRVSGLTGAVQ
jgi:putative transposase